MSRIINPILLRDTPATATGPRSASRKTQTTPANGAVFAQQLAATQPAATQTQNVQKAASITTAPTSLANQTATQQVTQQQTPPSYRSSTPGTNGIESTELDAPKDTSSWRVDRRAADVEEDVNDFTFEDFVDIINPLQHIPILSTAYREATGDDIKPVSQVAGGLLYGILTGSIIISALSSIVSAAYEQKTGEEPAMQVADALFGIKSNKETGATMLADAGKAAVENPSATAPAPVGNEGAIKLASASTEVEKETLPPLPVKTAALETPPASAASNAASNAAATGQIAPAVKTANKQPFGGIMDTSGASRNQRVAAKQLLPEPSVLVPGQGVKVGDTIYTTPLMSRQSRKTALEAARLAAQTKKDAPVTAPALTATQQLAAATSPSSVMSVVPGTEAADEKKLGQLMHRSAEVSQSGNTLPPNLVQDMMLMALDKYKTAGNLAPSEITIGNTLN